MDGRTEWQSSRQSNGQRFLAELTHFIKFPSYNRLSPATYDDTPDCLEVTQVPHSWLDKTHRFYLSHLDAGNLAWDLAILLQGE